MNPYINSPGTQNNRTHKRGHQANDLAEDKSKRGEELRKLKDTVQRSLSPLATKPAKSKKTIQEIMQKPNVFAIIGESHGEIPVNEERAYWAERGVTVYYEGDLLSLNVDGRKVEECFDDKYLKCIQSAEEIKDNLSFILDYKVKEDIPLLVLESALIAKLRSNLVTGLENMKGLNNLRTQQHAPARYSDEQIDIINKINQALVKVVGSAKSVTTKTSKFFGETHLALEEIHNFFKVVATGQEYVPIKELNLTDNRSIHMMIMAEEYAKKSSGRTIYKVGNTHISDILFRNNYQTHLSPDIPGTKVLIKSRESYLEDLNLQSK